MFVCVDMQACSELTWRRIITQINKRWILCISLCCYWTAGRDCVDFKDTNQCNAIVLRDLVVTRDLSLETQC